jgi:long-chain acyl-CoA synthetase
VSVESCGITLHANETPDKAALVLGGRVRTYAELDDRSNRLARVLGGLGAREDRVVAVVLPNCLEFFDVSAAAAKLQAPFLPVNWHLKAEELGYVLADSGASVVVTAPSLLPTVEAARAQAPGCRTLVTGPEYEAVLAGDGDDAGGVVRLESGAAPSFVFYTSGTTARPKGVIHGRFTGEVARRSQDGQVALWSWTADDVYVMAGPSYHAAHGGWASTALYVGATTVLLPSWDAREWLRMVDLHRATRSFLVPAHFIRILEVPDEERAGFDIASLRLVVHAAAPCPVAVKRRIMDALVPAEIHELYGASEGGATRIAPEEWLAHPGSVGRPWPGVEVRILGDDGAPVPAGEPGLIYVTPMGSWKFHYHNDPAKTSSAWRDDAFTVGDIGHLDDDGYLYITDRASDMVLWGGVNIAPREVEEVLHTHPDVVDCAVFGVPDARDGEHLKAVIEGRPGLRADELAAHVRAHLADYKVPREWDLVDQLPRDPSGKVLKRLLRQAARGPG